MHAPIFPHQTCYKGKWSQCVIGKYLRVAITSNGNGNNRSISVHRFWRRCRLVIVVVVARPSVHTRALRRERERERERKREESILHHIEKGRDRVIATVMYASMSLGLGVPGICARRGRFLWPLASQIAFVLTRHADVCDVCVEVHGQGEGERSRRGENVILCISWVLVLPRVTSRRT